MQMRDAEYLRSLSSLGDEKNKELVCFVFDKGVSMSFLVPLCRSIECWGVQQLNSHVNLTIRYMCTFTLAGLFTFVGAVEAWGPTN